MQNILRRICD